MSSKSKWWILLSGASLAAMGAVAPAAAQDVSDEIIVTATGRATAIQDVPIAITALNNEILENAGIRDIRELQAVAPSYKFFTGQSNTAGTNAIIRGIGTGGDNPGFEAAVGVFIDGVYRSRAGTALGDLSSIERVEVLRGPQGTLFGRNTSAGALNIVTQMPEFEPHMYLEGSGGNFDMLGTRFGFNAPLDDQFAVRFDGSIRERDGYITDLRSGNDTNTVNRGAARLQALWDVAPNASVRFILDGSKSSEECCYAVTLRRGPTGAAINGFLAGVPGAVGILPGDTPSAASFTPIGVGNPEDRQATITPGHEPNEDVEEWGASAQLDWDLGFAELTSITSYRTWDSLRDQDIDFSDFDRAYRDGLQIGFDTATEEIRLHGESGRLDWLVGAFFGNEVLDTTDRIRVGTHAAGYLDALASGSDLTALGVPDFNGAAPGSGLQIYNSLNNFDPDGPGPAPAMAPPIYWLQVAFGALASTQDVTSAGGIATATALGAGAAPGGLATALGVADPMDGDGQQADTWEQETNSFGLFTHNQFSISDNMLLTVGVRYNHEEKDLAANLSSVYPGCGAIQANAGTAAAVLGYTPNAATAGDPATLAAIRGLQSGILSFLTLACNPAINTIANGTYADAREEDEVTGTASLAYHITPDLMVYGGYSRGYKSGGFNVDRSGFNIVPFSVSTPSTNDLEFDPEFVNAYELGFKSTIFGGTTFFNANLFYEQITDFQVNAFSGFNFITFNAPELISKGVEIDLTSNLTDHLTVQAGLLYNDAYYNEGVVLPAGGAIIDGSRLAYASEWTATGSATYRQPIGANLSALFHVDARYNGEAPTQTLGRDPITDNEGYTIVNGRIGIGPNNERWSFEVFGTNLTDEYYNVGAFAVPEQTGTLAVYPNAPRMYGATVRFRY